MPNPQPLEPSFLMTEVIAHYDIAPPRDCTRFYSGANDLYRIETAGEPFIFKLYRAGWRSQPEVAAEMEALLHLGRKGVPVALPVARRDGAFSQALSLPEGERQAVLFHQASGEPLAEVDEACCRSLGRTLADLHHATDDFPGRYVRCDLEQLLDRPVRALEPLLEDRPEEQAFLRDLARRLRERLPQCPEEALDQGFCHGDFRPANAHRDDTGRVIVFDFEASGAGFRVYDLATLRYFLSGFQESGRCERLWDAFLAGYEERRPLSDADRTALPWFVPLRPIRILGNILQTSQRNWNLEAWKPSGAVRLPAFFDEVLPFFRQWDGDYLR